jgi:hypothetical protein
MSVSFLIPTRNRVELLKKCISQIINTYHGTVDFDILLRFDIDQTDQCDVINTWVSSLGYDKFVKTFCGYRFFYENIHKYYTELSFVSSKKWLWLWNDETLMQTDGWDKVISEHLNKFQLIFPRENSSFHLCPKKLVELIGYYAPTTNCDSWQGQLATDLNIVQWIDLKTIHDRYDITGNNLDETYLNRNYTNNTATNINNNQDEVKIISDYLLANGSAYE